TIGVLATDHGRLEHRGVPNQGPFHLDGRDPDPAALQHAAGAAAVPVYAGLFLVVLVPGLDPLAEERFLRLLVLVPVVRHRRVALDADVADLSQRHRTAAVLPDKSER